LSKHPTTYANQIKTLRRFFRDFLNKGHLVHSFKFPSIGYTPKIVPSKTQLQQFYTALDTNRDKALFLLYATTGLRKSEVVSLTLKDINRSQRMIFPNNHGHSVTKRSWISFYNHEAEHALETARAYLSQECPTSTSLFSLTRNWTYKTWLTVSQNTGIKVTPQSLRQWFCIEMADARARKTGYSSQQIKEI
jgi:integrase